MTAAELKSLQIDPLKIKENGKGLLIFSILLIVISLIVFGASLLKGTWDPIVEPKEQTILNRQDEPYSAGDVIRTVGTKCFKELPIIINGTNSFTSVTESGLVIKIYDGGRIFDPKHPQPGDEWNGNCITTRFSNEVTETLQRWSNQGLDKWRVTGTMQPVKKDKTGLTRVWFSEIFTVKKTIEK
jgi:hypothetical protein